LQRLLRPSRELLGDFTFQSKTLGRAHTSMAYPLTSYCICVVPPRLCISVDSFAVSQSCWAQLKKRRATFPLLVDECPSISLQVGFVVLSSVAEDETHVAV